MRITVPEKRQEEREKRKEKRKERKETREKMQGKRENMDRMVWLVGRSLEAITSCRRNPQTINHKLKDAATSYLTASQ